MTRGDKVFTGAVLAVVVAMYAVMSHKQDVRVNRTWSVGSVPALGSVSLVISAGTNEMCTMHIWPDSMVAITQTKLGDSTTQVRNLTRSVIIQLDKPQNDLFYGGRQITTADGGQLAEITRPLQENCSEKYQYLPDTIKVAIKRIVGEA